MNSDLNNIFDEDSLNAIRNADKISPSPESLQAKKENVTETVEYQEIKAEPTKDKVNYDMDKIDRIISENRDLKIKVEAQKELIHKIIESQNQMIKEINRMQTRLAEYEEAAKKVPEVKKAVQEEIKKEESQQTGAGEGLNPDDFSVENIFYMGK